MGGFDEAVKKRLTLADWGLRLLSPDDRAGDLVKFLDPRNENGKLKKLKWTGRVPDDLAKKAEGGILTLAAIKEWYGKHRRYCVLQSEQLYLSPAVEKAARTLFADNPRMRPSLVYLADQSRSWRQEDAVRGGGRGRSGQGAELAGAAEAGRDPARRLARVAAAADRPAIRSTSRYYSPDERNHLELDDDRGSTSPV